MCHACKESLGLPRSIPFVYDTRAEFISRGHIQVTTEQNEGE